MAQAAAQQQLLTAEGFFDLPEDGREYELVRGELVEISRPGYRHGQIMVHVGALLLAHVRAHDLGDVVGGDPGFILEREPDTVRGPDVAFVARERVTEAEQARTWPELAPDLVVEILSPSNRPGEVADKVGQYLAAGARVILVMDPQRRTVVAHRPGGVPRTLHGADAVDVDEVLPGFSATVDELFG